VRIAARQLLAKQRHIRRRGGHRQSPPQRGAERIVLAEGHGPKQRPAQPRQSFFANRRQHCAQKAASLAVGLIEHHLGPPANLGIVAAGGNSQ
jgi:hypothetical protein